MLHQLHTIPRIHPSLTRALAVGWPCMLPVVFWLMMLCHPCLANGGNLVHFFSVWRNGKQIGTVQVSRSDSAGGFIYAFQSIMEAWLLVPLKVRAQSRNYFRQGHLENAYSLRTLNGGRRREIVITRRGNAYVVENNREVEAQVFQPISYTSLSLYFGEPSQVSSYFSENLHRFIAIQRTGPSSYEIKLPDGDVSRYWYRNGELLKVESETSFGTVQFIRQNQ